MDKTNFKKFLLHNKKNKRVKNHSIHKYYGKLIPAIPFTAIDLYSKKGDLVFDPFCGSGTTGLEAIINGRKFIGTEINPVAVMISKTKLSAFNKNTLEKDFEKILNKFKKIITFHELYIPNVNHWFTKKDFKDLCKLYTVIVNSVKGKNKLFFRNVYSAIIRQVSMSDPTHIFPGKSKRMKLIIENGDFNVDIIDKFTKAYNKAYDAVIEHKSNFKIYNKSADIFINNLKTKVDLIVTNPPYISSIRYEEATKFEIYLNEFAKTPEEFKKMAEKFIGYDKHIKSQIKEIKLNYSKFSKVISKISDDKNKHTASLFFLRMEKVIKNMQKYLKKNGKVVMKIGDSKLSGSIIPTGLILNEIAQANGFNVIDTFNDKIKNRSLTTARNTYSGLIKFDRILIWEKI